VLISFKQRELQKQIFYTIAFVAALIAYVFWESPDIVEFRYGIIVTALLMLLVASPLISLVSSALASGADDTWASK
jgi:solute carrier family 50 protein (sugar transporter)